MVNARPAAIHRWQHRATGRKLERDWPVFVRQCNDHFIWLTTISDVVTADIRLLPLFGLATFTPAKRDLRARESALCCAETPRWCAKPE
jgi:hypothetical protein